ncbi:hypothetical protein [Saccharolobus solfataricus]|uniref:hypothetical protein n=1 Tax=Saccharolobus solfataricus TaxID=2287 RepID=UPI0001C39573
MILVQKSYADIVLVFDTIMLTTSLLFRRSKHKKETLRLKPKSLGYYLIVSSTIVLITIRLAIFPNYIDYLEGLALNGFLFYLGLRMVVVKGE